MSGWHPLASRGCAKPCRGLERFASLLHPRACAVSVCTCTILTLLAPCPMSVFSLFLSFSWSARRHPLRSVSLFFLRASRISRQPVTVVTMASNIRSYQSPAPTQSRIPPRIPQSRIIKYPITATTCTDGCHPRRRAARRSPREPLPVGLELEESPHR